MLSFVLLDGCSSSPLVTSERSLSVCAAMFEIIAGVKNDFLLSAAIDGSDQVKTQ